jgi:hypothetical protein
LVHVIRKATPDLQAHVRAAGNSWLSSPGVLEKWSEKSALERLALEVRNFAWAKGS